MIVQVSCTKSDKGKEVATINQRDDVFEHEYKAAMQNWNSIDTNFP